MVLVMSFVLMNSYLYIFIFSGIRPRRRTVVKASPSGRRTSVVSMSLKTGIVGLPNVGKVYHETAICASFTCF